MKYKATLHNNTCAFDSVILSNVDDDIQNKLVIIYNVKNNRFYKVKK